MHELGATQGMLAVAIDAAREAGRRRVLAVDVVIGELSSFVDDSVRLYFDLLSRGTPAEGAVLTIRRVPGQATCSDCGARWAVRPPLDPLCPMCAGALVNVAGGQQLRVESIEVEDEAQPDALREVPQR